MRYMRERGVCAHVIIQLQFAMGVTVQCAPVLSQLTCNCNWNTN